MVGIVCLVLSLCLLRESCSVGFLFVFFFYFPLVSMRLCCLLGLSPPPPRTLPFCSPALAYFLYCRFFILYCIKYFVFYSSYPCDFESFFFVSRYFFFCSFWVFLPKFGSQILVRLHYFYRIKDLRVGSSSLLGEVV